MTTSNERWRGPAIIATFFSSLMLVSGPVNVALGVLFTPWLREFHWSHAQVAQVAAAMALTTGMCSPLVGWLIDRVGAQWAVGTGFATIGICLLVASGLRTHPAMVALFAVIGLGGALTGFLPIMVVIVNWFEGRGGFFGGVVSFGFGLGMTLTPPLLTAAIARLGWRLTLRWMTLPAFFLILPLVLSVVRTRPRRATGATRPARGADHLSGLEPAAALRSAAFWLIVLTQFLGTLGFSAVFVHTITYLIGVGYTPQHAALIFSSQTLVSCPGVVIMGWLGDRYRPQPVLAICALLMGGAMLALLGAANPRLAPLMIPLFALCWGAGAGTNNTVLTVLLAQTMGLRRLGTMIGIKYFVAAVAMSFGPLLSGRLYDLSGSYNRPFELAALMMVGSAIAVSLVRVPDSLAAQARAVAS